jgi:hypothetical protein
MNGSGPFWYVIDGDKIYKGTPHVVKLVNRIYNLAKGDYKEIGRAACLLPWAWAPLYWQLL